MNRIDLLALTLAVPLQHKPVLDSLAVHPLENRVYIDGSRAIAISTVVLLFQITWGTYVKT